MEYETILYDLRDRIATVTLNKPEDLNGFTPEMMAEVSDVFSAMSQDDEVAVTIITGAGRAFCAGHSMRNPNLYQSTPASPTPRTTVHPSSSGGGYGALWNYPKPLIAAVNGPAYGGGLSMVLGCDIIIASTEARFCYPQARIGQIPAWPGSQALALFVGKAKASEMALTARAIDGEDAYRWGLANKVVAPEELADEARAYAQHIAGLAPLSLRLIKDDLRESWEPHFTRGSNQLRGQIVFNSEDRVEGHVAWKEKRPPIFKGR